MYAHKEHLTDHVLPMFIKYSVSNFRNREKIDEQNEMCYNIIFISSISAALLYLLPACVSLTCMCTSEEKKNDFLFMRAYSYMFILFIIERFFL